MTVRGIVKPEGGAQSRNHTGRHHGIELDPFPLSFRFRVALPRRRRYNCGDSK